MLPKKFRLHNDKDIKRLVQGGKTFFLPQMIIKYQKNNQLGTRLAVVVSTRVDKRAVVRNRVKRQIREVLRMEVLKIKKNQDILFIIKKSCLDLSFVDIKKQINFALITCRLYD